MVAQGAPCSRLTPCLVGHLARVFPHSATLQGPQHGAQGAAPGADFCPGLLPRRFLIWTEKRAWATVPQHRRSVASPPPPESGRGGMKIIMRKAVRTPLRASNSQLKEGQGISCLIGY